MLQMTYNQLLVEAYQIKCGVMRGMTITTMDLGH
jgi:hypothetical protein